MYKIETNVIFGIMEETINIEQVLDDKIYLQNIANTLFQFTTGCGCEVSRKSKSENFAILKITRF